MLGSAMRMLAAAVWTCSMWFISSAAYYAARGRTEQAMWIGPLLSDGTAAGRIVPWTILITFLLLLIMIVGRAFAVRGESFILAQFPSSPTEAYSREQRIRNSPAVADKRLRWILSQSRDSAARARLVETLPAQASLDAIGLANSYVPLRVFVWLLPVLGFVGTAWGMSLAIGSFSQALSEVSDTRGLTLRLSQLVIPSLAHAFHITMFALAASMVGYFCTSILQARHEDVQESLDRKSLALAVMFLPPPSGEEGLSSALYSLNHSIGTLNNSLGTFAGGRDGNEVLARAAQQLEAASASVQEAGHQLNSAAELLTKELEKPLTFTLSRENHK